MRILLIGAINQKGQPQGGEEYKNRLLQHYLSMQYELYVVDTHHWKKSPAVIFSLLINVFFTRLDRIIISASSHSVYRLVQLFQFFPWISRKSLYFVIGGYFPSALLLGVFKPEPYEKLHSVVVEGTGMRTTLLQAGFRGTVHVVPNFKQFPKNLALPTKNKGTFKFLFLSRIHPDKGVGEIFAASRLLEEWGIKDFSVTFYGPIEKNYREYFESALGANMTYGGVLDIMNDNENAYNILAGFDAMLFPTYWKGEGFPGVLVDAFVAGLPVIATDWNMNTEVIKHEQNGLLIPARDFNALANAMRQLIASEDIRTSMAKASASSALRFHIDAVWPQIKEIIEA